MNSSRKWRSIIKSLRSFFLIYSLHYLYREFFLMVSLKISITPSQRTRLQRIAAVRLVLSCAAVPGGNKIRNKFILIQLLQNQLLKFWVYIEVLQKETNLNRCVHIVIIKLSVTYPMIVRKRELMTIPIVASILHLLRRGSVDLVLIV